MKIIVNGNEFEWSGDSGNLIYEAILKCAGINGSPSMTYSVPRSNPVIQGSLAPGESVKPVDGMVFNAMHTGNA